MILLLGGDGRLARRLRRHGEEAGLRVISTSRRRSSSHELPFVDVLEERWRRLEGWEDTFRAHALDISRLTAIVNLITQKDAASGRSGEADVAGVRAMCALRRAALAAGAKPTTIHVGSLSEARPAGEQHHYATAKQEARRACRGSRDVDLILTLPILREADEKPSGARLSIRRALRFLPALSARVRVPTATLEEAASSIVALAGDAGRALSWAETLPLELVLCGSYISLAEFFQLPVRKNDPAPSLFERATWVVLARSPFKRSTLLARLSGFARMLSPDGAANHYRAADCTDDKVGLAAGSPKIGRWSILAPPTSLGYLLSQAWRSKDD